MGFRLANVDGRAALVSGDDYYDLERLSAGKLGPDPMFALRDIDGLSQLQSALASHEATGRLADVHLGPPAPRPGQCFGIGLNYRNHAEEGGMPIPKTPMVFAKFASCITGPDNDVELRSDHVDYEGELVVVIGRTGRDIPIERGWHHVAGLCIGQDISDRPVQMACQPPQFNLGKSFDTYGPMGPVLISPDELESPDALDLETRINGELRQQDSTRDLIFDVPTLVSYLSHIATLHPGDVIFTGTPGGVGMASGSFLKDADVITTTIAGLGTLTNRCVRVTDHPHASDPLPAPLSAIVKK